MNRVRSITRKTGPRRARAAAVVEFAIVCPILLTILFGIIEYGHLFMVRQTLTNAAREGCRIAFLQSTEEPYSEVTARVDEVMTAAGLTGYSTDMTHAGSANGWVETIAVSIPRSQVSLLADFFGSPDGMLSGTCSMRKAGVGL
ncbi:MAG TPA: TadE family protein [Phycisphaerae bacterium]|nr:TadE family protein [Phycisphaerae bacterium]